MPEILYRYRNWLFLSYLGLSVFFLWRIESVFNGGFFFSLQALWLPLAVIIFGYTWWHRKYFYSVNKRKFSTWFVAILLYAISILMTWPYVMAVNAFTGEAQEITYDGYVENKFISKGKSWTYHYVIRNQETGEAVTLNCTKDEYSKLSVGDFVVEQFLIGGLDLPYRWR